jgi:hypothetical protein
MRFVFSPIINIWKKYWKSVMEIVFKVQGQVKELVNLIKIRFVYDIFFFYIVTFSLKISNKQLILIILKNWSNSYFHISNIRLDNTDILILGLYCRYV